MPERGGRPGPFDPGPLSEPKPQRSAPKRSVPRPRLPSVSLPRPKLPKLSRPSLPKRKQRPPKQREPKQREPKQGAPKQRALKQSPAAAPAAPRRRKRAPTRRRPQSGPAPRPLAPRRRLTLVRGAAVLAVVAAIAVGIGLGSQIQDLLSGDTGAAVSHSARLGPPPAKISSGTSASLSAGPYFPLIGTKWTFATGAGRFGADRGYEIHPGQDILADAGTPIISVRDGVVLESESLNSPRSGGRGNYIGIYSPVDHRTYVYLHMLHPSTLQAGDRVVAGQRIGLVGCTGSCDGDHLHLEIRLGRSLEAKPIDPLPFLKKWPEFHP